MKTKTIYVCEYCGREFVDKEDCMFHELACTFAHYDCKVQLWDDCGEVELDFTKSPSSIQAIWFDGQAETAEALEIWFEWNGCDSPSFANTGLYVYDGRMEDWIEVDAMIKHYQALKNIVYK